MDVKRITIKNLKKKSEVEPRSVKIIENNNLLVLVTVPPFGVILVVSVWIDSSREVGLSKSRRTMENEDMGLEASLRDSRETIKSWNTIILSENRKGLTVSPKLFEGNTTVEAFLE